MILLCTELFRDWTHGKSFPRKSPDPNSKLLLFFSAALFWNPLLSLFPECNLFLFFITIFNSTSPKHFIPSFQQCRAYFSKSAANEVTPHQSMLHSGRVYEEPIRSTSCWKTQEFERHLALTSHGSYWHETENLNICSKLIYTSGSKIQICLNKETIFTPLQETD